MAQRANLALNPPYFFCFVFAFLFFVLFFLFVLKLAQRATSLGPKPSLSLFCFFGLFKQNQKPLPHFGKVFLFLSPFALLGLPLFLFLFGSLSFFFFSFFLPSCLCSCFLLVPCLCLFFFFLSFSFFFAFLSGRKTPSKYINWKFSWPSISFLFFLFIWYIALFLQNFQKACNLLSLLHQAKACAFHDAIDYFANFEVHQTPMHIYSVF